MLISFFLFSLIAQENSQSSLSPEARIWDMRQEEISDLQRQLGRVLKQNGRAVRRGNENPRVDSLIAQAVTRINQRLKKRKLGLPVSINGAKIEPHYPLTSLEIDSILSSMDPYRREFAESSMQAKKIIGNFLHGRELNPESVPESAASKAFIDLENYTSTGDRKFDEVIESFIKRGGKRSIALIFPKLELPDGSYSAGPRYVVEQLKSGSIQVFQERIKARQADTLSIQVFSEAPRKILLIAKSELRSAINDKTPIKSFVVTQYPGESPKN